MLKLDLSTTSQIDIEDTDSFDQIPRLEHNLKLVVQKPGIYPIQEMAKLQDDGGEFLRKIYQVDELEMENIPEYTPPSKDTLLYKFAKNSKIKYIMSTSTVSSVLIQLFYHFSGHKNPKMNNLGQNFLQNAPLYMVSQRKPITCVLKVIDKEKNIYALDSDKSMFYENNQILMDLGKVLERQYTMTKEVFQKSLLKVDHPDQLYSSLERIEIIPDDLHRFMKLNDEICLRAQIDCADYDLETGKPYVYEIKTRALCPLRYDIENYKEYLDYRIKGFRGFEESFEREYFDLSYFTLFQSGVLLLNIVFNQKLEEWMGLLLDITTHNKILVLNMFHQKKSKIEFLVQRYILMQFLLFVQNNLQKYLIMSQIFYMIKIIIHQNSDFILVQDQVQQLFLLNYYKKVFVFKLENNIKIHRTPEVQDEYDFYTKVYPFKNKVYKFQLQMSIFNNGVYQLSQHYQINGTDQIDVGYKITYIGKAQFDDYMNFLHDAYKIDSINLDDSYCGTWRNY